MNHPKNTNMTASVTNKIQLQMQQLIMAAETNGYDAVKEEMGYWYSICLNKMEKDSAYFLGTLLLGAYMGSKGNSNNKENIYLKNYDVSQIRLFEILIDKLPYVKYSQQMINQSIAQLLDEKEEATLIDIGIGLGTQVLHILNLCKGAKQLKKLVIVGIEPAAEAIANAGAAIMHMQATLPFTIEFRSIVGFAETTDLTAIDYGSSHIVVNASLALHHIQQADKRDSVFAQLHAIHPAGLFLIEPNSNHFDPDFNNRFNNCFRHFYHLFKTIDGLSILHAEKNALKLFFGREIEDIIGKPEAMRFEKHEPANHWIGRMQQAGFCMQSHRIPIAVDMEAGVNIRLHQEGYVGFSFGNETVLSLMYAA